MIVIISTLENSFLENHRHIYFRRNLMITFQKIKQRLIFLAIVIFLSIFLFTACTSRTQAKLVGATYVVVIEGEGTVTSNPAGINCSDIGGECSMVSTDVLSFTAVPKSGWAFNNWSSSEYCDFEGNNPCERLDDNERENINITAVFFKPGGTHDDLF